MIEATNHVDGDFACSCPECGERAGAETVVVPQAATPPALRSMALAIISDDDLIDHIENLDVELERARELLGGLRHAACAEAERRIRERGAKEIPHPRFEIALKDEFSEYVYDLVALRAAKKLLPENEGAKILKHVPERVEVIAAHDVPGPAVSIKALAEKYKGSLAGGFLAEAMTRSSLGSRFIFKRRKGA